MTQLRGDNYRGAYGEDHSSAQNAEYHNIGVNEIHGFQNCLTCWTGMPGITSDLEYKGQS